MNKDFAREVGYLRYIVRRLIWRLNSPSSVKLHNGAIFPTPKESPFASDVFVTDGNVDWSSEYILIAFVESQEEKGDFLDVGANIGYYSALLGKHFQRTWAFEPDERNHHFLELAIKDNKTCKVVKAAVSDKTEDVFLDMNDASTVSHLTTKEGEHVSKVSGITLDDFVHENEAHPVAIKMDIEGFEVLALRGALKVMEAYEPVILIEFNIEEGRPNTWDALEEITQASGYTVYAVSRTKDEGADYDYKFKVYQISELDQLDTKMLFLVSEKYKNWFEEFSMKYGSWKGSFLRRRSVVKMLSNYISP